MLMRPAHLFSWFSLSFQEAGSIGDRSVVYCTAVMPRSRCTDQINLVELSADTLFQEERDDGTSVGPRKAGSEVAGHGT